VEVVLPVPDAKLPAGAKVQEAWPDVLVKEPAAHNVEVVLPVPEAKLPAGADVHEV